MKNQELKATTTSKLSQGWVRFLQGGITTIRSVISFSIKDELAKRLWLLSLEPSDKIVNALADDNPNDRQQVLEIVRRHTNTQIVPLAEEQFEQRVIANIKNHQLKAFVEVLSVVPLGAARIYTDEDPSNEDQIKTFIEAWLESPENQDKVFQDVLQPWLDSVFKNNPIIGKFIIDTIQGQLEGLNIDIEGDGK